MWIAPHFWAYYRTAPNNALLRESFEWIEVDQSFCEKIFGVGLCPAVLTAGTEKCFNTLNTCPRTDAYLQGVNTLRFCRDTQRLPNDGLYYFPFLVDAKIKPCAINPGGGNRNASALGTRATLTATLRDGPHTDRIVDKYAEERLTGAALFSGIGYNPLERSTFWRKWAARNLYKLNRVIRHCSGYIDENGQVSDVVRREFVITGFAGPTANARVTFEAKDVLTKVNNEKAQAPLPSTGKLLAAITNVATSATLTPAGIGNAEYATSGVLRIGSEMATFTRVADALTLVRGQFNTVAEAHSANDTVQTCLRFISKTPADILRTLLVDYGGIDANKIDTANWTAETTAFLSRLYSTIITEPTGIAQLVGELSEQMYLYVWFDERTGLIRLRAVRLAEGDPVRAIGENELLSDSVDVAEQSDQLITRVVVNYAPRDYTKKWDDITNYAVTDVFGEFEEEGPQRNDGIKAKTIFSRWLEGTDGAAAIDLGENILARYKAAPRKVTFTMDAKDRSLWVSDFAAITSRQITNEVGLPETTPIQIMEASERVSEGRCSYVAQQFLFAIPSSAKSVVISADINDVDLRALYNAKYATPPGAETITFIVRPGVVVGSTSTATAAMTTGAWPVTTGLLLKNDGHIVGRGGDGGAGSWFNASTVGGNGGTALAVTVPIDVDNAAGIIGGGGGGGGGGDGDDPVTDTYTVGGGGGAGRVVAPGGVAAPAIYAQSGNAGTLTIGGNGGIATGGGYGTLRGGRGGDLGSNGSSSNAKLSKITSNTRAGGLAGIAVQGVAFVNYINAGDIRGAQV